MILQTVQGRGAAVIKARKLSSAMSAAKAIVDHMRDWWHGTTQVCCHGDRKYSHNMLYCVQTLQS